MAYDQWLKKKMSRTAKAVSFIIRSNDYVLLPSRFNIPIIVM